MDVGTLIAKALTAACVTPVVLATLPEHCRETADELAAVLQKKLDERSCCRRVEVVVNAGYSLAGFSFTSGSIDICAVYDGSRGTVNNNNTDTVVVPECAIIPTYAIVRVIDGEHTLVMNTPLTAQPLRRKDGYVDCLKRLLHITEYNPPTGVGIVMAWDEDILEDVFAEHGASVGNTYELPPDVVSALSGILPAGGLVAELPIDAMSTLTTVANLWRLFLGTPYDVVVEPSGVHAKVHIRKWVPKTLGEYFELMKANPKDRYAMLDAYEALKVEPYKNELEKARLDLLRAILEGIFIGDGDDTDAGLADLRW